MNKRSSLSILAAAALVLTAIVRQAEAKKAAPATPPPAVSPTNAFQNDFLLLLDDVQKKIVSLEDATPQDKLKWRPAPGVRSIAEAYLHIAYGNYSFTKGAIGREPPADAGWQADRAKWDAQTTDKAEIKKILERSFDHLRAAMKDVRDADLDKLVDRFGHQMTARAVWMALIGHLNEHLGQEVAYARANGIVPPWSAAQSR